MNNAAGSAEQLDPGVVVRDTREIGSHLTRRTEERKLGYRILSSCV